MANTATHTKKAPAAKKAGKKTMGEKDAIILNTPPSKKQRASSSASHFSTNTLHRHTVNPYVKGNKKRINVILHKGGVPSKDAQPQVVLLPGGRTLSLQWKSPEKLFSGLQAATQGFSKDSSRYVGYSDTIQLMANAGVTAFYGFHWGAPQLIQLDVECTGNPKVTNFHVPKEFVRHNSKDYQQFNLKYVCRYKWPEIAMASPCSQRRGGLRTLAC